ncbi:ZDBF2 protein, partial [Drymodes brunneopygia]|nr:ZDBF2 protein [Drymodes brunneopygia]
MFERIKRSDEASASSAQGKKFKKFKVVFVAVTFKNVIIINRSISSPCHFLHRGGQEHPRPGASAVQNRQGYCNCCHVHYSNLEQHIFSSQHRHFTTYCRNRMGTSSLMERFLQDVLLHHPHRYHDSRPTYDDIPLPITLESPRISCLSSEEMQKKRSSEKQEISSKHQESIHDIGSSVPCLSREGTKKTFVTQAGSQKLPRGQDRVPGISQQSTGICSEKKWVTLKNARIANHSHESQFTALSPVPQQFSLSPTSHSSSVN